MRNLGNYSTLKELIDKILEKYSNNDDLKKHRQKLDSLLSKAPLPKKKDFYSFLIKDNHNLLGVNYQSNLNASEKKERGKFYTPLKIVRYIFNRIGYSINDEIEGKNLIDLSCGSGSFLIQAVKILTLRLLFKFKVKNVSEIGSKQVLSIIEKVKNNIFGVDKDPFACILCQINIILVLYPLISKILNEGSIENYLLFNIKNCDTIDLYNNNLSSKNEKIKFDYIVGNPPYVFIREIPTKQKEIIKASPLKTKKGQYDLYQIFIEIGIKFLKNRGYLGYIVPDSILALSFREDIRRFIYKTTQIKEVFLTGPKFQEAVVSNVILILRKENIELYRDNNYIKMISPQNAHEIKQTIIKTWNFKFLVNLSEIDVKILNYLNENFIKLKNIEEKQDARLYLGRGVELSKEGKIIYCTICDRYYPLPKNRGYCVKCKEKFDFLKLENIILDKIPKGQNRNYRNFIYSIQRYRIKKLKYINVNKKGINYKLPEMYKDRIIIRQIAKKNLICATYEKKYALTSQSLYNLKIQLNNNPYFNNYYLLGLLNSRLLSYYFMKSFGSYKTLFPRILIEKIKEFPIKLPISQKEKELADGICYNVKILLNRETKNGVEYRNFQEIIDSLVYQIYKVEPFFRTHINSYYQD